MGLYISFSVIFYVQIDDSYLQERQQNIANNYVRTFVLLGRVSYDILKRSYI